MKLTASNIVNAINKLDKNRIYNYIHSGTKEVIKIHSIQLPEGPIKITRWNPYKGENELSGKTEPISSEMIWRIANAFMPEHPINFDRVLGGSYNTRSALEALIAHTPEFYYCYPGRIQNINGIVSVKKGHKHIMWKPDAPHTANVTVKAETNIEISEIPSQEILYESLTLPSQLLDTPLDINVRRRHAQIQIALYFIGKQLGYKTWIAENDKGLEYQNKKICEYDGILSSLKDETLLSNFSNDIVDKARLIDCIWFESNKSIPAIMEVEHTTGVTSGLNRMKIFRDAIPSIKTRYIIVAPDDDRDKVIERANAEHFKDLNIRYFPYSAVEELYALCQRRKLRGTTEQFLECYMESVNL
ncbi:hypothetical protein [Bacteroides fluxus]|uniref:hypothetical protein n=1 Tax=Bacteroides fluxus TaxID=626930 RepID=UPI0023543578|nr:hypothetical protein [Bacteroides fluxus]